MNRPTSTNPSGRSLQGPRRWLRPPDRRRGRPPHPSRITHVEDALLELVRNARDAGAANIYVASTLKDRRFRTLTVIDDGHGIPESHRDLILEPGVTTRHLDPVTEPDDPSPHGAGLSLYQIKAHSIETSVLSTSSPTSIQATFDTNTLPERTLQSANPPSNSNLRAHPRTLYRKAANAKSPTLHSYYGPPARILATLLHHRIIQTRRDSAGLREAAFGLGLGVSVRSVQRILRGEVRPVEGVSGRERGDGGRGCGGLLGGGMGGLCSSLGRRKVARIADILRRAARAGYLEVEELRFESRPGEISLRARVYEPEEEYE